MTIDIAPANLDAPEFAELVATHVLCCDETAPPNSCHRLPLEDLAQDDVSVWQATFGGDLIGMGALKALSVDKGEVKSMHTLAKSRGLGAGKKLLEAILSEARARGYSSLWLETGVHSSFAAAHRLYKAYGFTECGPFGSYKTDPHSLFMTLDLNNTKPGT